MRDAEHLVERLQSIEADLRDLAYDRLRAAAEDGDADALADEKKVLQARPRRRARDRGARRHARARLTARRRGQPCAISAMRRPISSGETSSTWLAMLHRCPNGSSNWPERSP